MSSKLSVQRFAREQKRMADKLKNAEIGQEGAYNTLDDLFRAHAHQENSKKRLQQEIDKLKPLQQISTVHGVRFVGSPTADADKAIMLEGMTHHLDLHKNDKKLKELGQRISDTGKNLDGTISNKEKVMKNQERTFGNVNYQSEQKAVGRRHRNRRRQERLPPISEGGRKRKTKKRKKTKRKKTRRHKKKRRKKRRTKRRTKSRKI